jgi:DNA-binding FrmR family transcriptional regulator
MICKDMRIDEDDNNFQLQLEEADLKKILQRIHRAQGQINAVENMVEEGKNFEDTVTQLQAVISALKGVRNELLQQKVKVRVMEELQSALKAIK